jgi:hypothetical protein
MGVIWGEILGAILVKQVGYLSGPLKWVRFGCKVDEVAGVIMWPTQMHGILATLFVNRVVANSIGQMLAAIFT